ncbi:MAG: hypothetical protein A4E38_00578 [Methanoregulaceae archaeon PtaB.Bin108]|nr:MAG: hypothetical protein A4E38_00578 [Methanoregulaceae archaeon PtaB.Bin108]
MIARVCGSVATIPKKSTKPRSIWFPTLMIRENPISSAMLQSTIVVITAPLCEMNPMGPSFGEMGSKVAFRFV